MNKAFGKDIEPRCEYCARGELSPDGESVLCIKRGVMLTYSHCRKFTYDPLKRQPSKKPPLPEFSKEDFSL